MRVRCAAPALLVLTTVVMYWGNIIVTSVAFATPVQHWPLNRSLAIACVKSFVGMGGAAVTQLYRALYGVPTDDPAALRCLLLWAGATIICAGVSATAVPELADAEGGAGAEPVRMLHWVFAEIFILGVFTTATPHLTGAAHTALVVVMLLLTFLPIGLALGVDGRRAPSTNPNDEESRSPSLALEGAPIACAPSDVAPVDPVAVGPGAIQLAGAEDDEVGSAKRPLTESETQLPFREMVRTPEAWLLYWCGLVLIGSGNCIATQMAFIFQSADAAEELVTTCVTTFSVGNLFGRLLIMRVTDGLTRRGMSRAWFVVASCVLMGLAQLGFLIGAVPGAIAGGSAAQSSLYTAASGGAGLAFGSIWPLLVVLTSEIFGSTHLPTNYLFYDGGCGSVGTVVLANLLPSSIYEMAGAGTGGNSTGTFLQGAAASGRGAAAALGNGSAVCTAPGDAPDRPKVCLGPTCFADTHVVLIVLCALGVLAAAELSRRTTPLYARLAAAA